MRWCLLCTVAVLVVAAGCGSDDDESKKAQAEAARRIAGGMHGAVLASEVTRAPFRCARLDSDSAAELELGTVGPRQATQTGATVRFSGSANDRKLVVGVVADARGASSEAVAAVARFRSAMVAAGVELVVVLGGMSRGSKELTTFLRLLSESNRWPILVLPGDREELPAMREAIAAAGGTQAGILDGSEVRLLTMDGTALATFPGMAHPQRLVAGSLGCVHDKSDAEALAKSLKSLGKPRVWLTYAPPRLTASGSSDVATGGIHVGEIEQTSAIASAGAQLVIHASVDEAAIGTRKGTATLTSVPTVLGVGSADPLPVTNTRGDTVRSMALIVEITRERARWERITGQ